MGCVGFLFMVTLFSMAHAKWLYAETSEPKFQTNYGTVVGQKIMNCDVFLGVPFAEPPVGELRFKAPEPMKKSKQKQFLAKAKKPDCMQSNISASKHIDEDCLYMNIYKPSTPSTNDSLPVVIFYPGGNFVSGGCWDELYDATILAPDVNAIVVCANYRLGVFGFLYYKDDKEGTEGDILGNFGMKDQIAALKFIRENIRNLGGNPDKITIAGQSAGAQSVAVHLTSKQDKDLFQQAILMSGPYSISLKTEEEALKMGKKFLKEVECDEPVLSCLQNRNVEDLNKASSNFLISFNIWVLAYEFMNIFDSKVFHVIQSWGPTVETQPISQFQNVEKPVMIGSLSGDGKSFSFPPLNFFPQILLKMLLPNDGSTVFQKYQEWYKSGDIFAHFLTDYMYTCPARFAALDMNSQSVYDYYFDHVLSFTDKFSPWWCHQYACHGNDVPFFFQSASFIGFNLTKDEEKLVDIYSSYLANFIHHGDPNDIPNNSVQPKVSNLNPWPPIDPNPENLWTLVFSTEEPVVSKLGIKKEQCEFWDVIGYYNVVRLNKK